MKKMKTGIGVMLALLCCILMCTGVVYATGDDTDGTELQVAQPVILEVQLGPQWAGVEFQLKTDAGLYPGTIAVGQEGILRTELGNSGIPVMHIILFGGGLLLAAGALVAMRFIRNRRPSERSPYDPDDEDDDEDEYEY